MNLLEHMPPDWREAIAPYLQPATLDALQRFVTDEYGRGTVYPPPEHLFRAFAETPCRQVRLVLLGQDPYHGEGQACGLAFAVRPGVRWPASLRNIWREFADDLQVTVPPDADFAQFASRGVLMLNTVLTVRAGAAGSHQNHGWEMVTDAAIRALSRHGDPMVFLLWGKPAERKRPLIDTTRHRILTSAHPSPLSAYRGFFGSRPFSRVNDALAELGRPPLDWTLA